MKPGKILQAGLVGILAMAVSISSRGDDTDLFTINPVIDAERPNVLFVLDNTANWNNAFTYEKSTLQTVVTGLDDKFNVGLMMFSETGGGNSNTDGGYVRYAVRQLESTNKTALVNVVGALDSNNDKSNNQKASLAMWEVYQYYAGLAPHAGNNKLKTDFTGNTYISAPVNASHNAISSFSGTPYSSPIEDSCQKNFVIYISNGKGSENNSDINASEAALAAVGGSTTPISMTNNDYQSNVGDEWARFMANNDVKTSLAGTQNVITYVVYIKDPGDAAGQHPAGWEVFLRSMASNGKGKFFMATNATALADALNKIFEEVQAVNSVYSSSTLPVSVNVRGTYLNQVYMGVFRPDPNSSPRWTGNIKQYKLAVDTSTYPPTLFLAGKNGSAAESATSGFITPSAQSFWTTASSFWNASYYPNSQGSGGISDLPDGDLVEKGGAAEHLRNVYATSQATRKLYTCTTGCTANSLLSATPFDTANTAITQALLGAANATERDNIINWVRGANNKLEDNPNLLATSIRGYVHGDVLHSRPAVINYNRYTDDRDIVVYYGENNGVFHAVKGGQDDTDGNELWGFVIPEHFSMLKRLRDASPVISPSTPYPPPYPKPYFADGPVSIDQRDINIDGKLVAADGDKVNLFVGMHRGGRFYYAMDVSDPDNPKYLWKKSNADTGYAELGQTWSEPKVAKIRYQANPVLIFGLGYDAAANDPPISATPPPAATMGRGVMIADAATGAPIWQAGPAPTGAGVDKTVADMIYSIPADVTVLDTDSSGLVDRIYAADTGGNVWRINIDDANPANWTVSKLASVGGTGANARKFLYPQDVVYTATYDAVLIGSGDREHPFDTAVQNSFYMFKDDHGLNATKATITEASMYDATENLIQIGTSAQQAAATIALNSSDGWYIKLSSGEKVVGGATTLGGAVFFATNKPVSTLTAGACASNLGEARIYGLNYLNAASIIDYNITNSLTTEDRYKVRPGGGFPPTPVPVVVEIGGKRYEAVITGTQVETPPSTVLEKRYRTYWHIEMD
jgi:type IV pilus assembly protein PilY1